MKLSQLELLTYVLLFTLRWEVDSNSMTKIRSKIVLQFVHCTVLTERGVAVIVRLDIVCRDYSVLKFCCTHGYL